MPIRWKITLWYSSILSLILLLVGIFLYIVFVQRETSAFDANLRQTGAEVIRSIKVENNLFLFPFQTQIVLPELNIFSTANTFLQAIDTSGRIVDRSDSLGNNSLPISKRILAEVAKGESGFETITLDQVKIRIFTTPIMTDNNQIFGILQVGGTLDHIERTLANLRLILLLVFSITILIVGGVAWFLAKRVLRPIDHLIKTTSEIEKGQDLKQRIEYDGPNDEIGQLIEQSNHMFARLDRVYEELEQSYQMQKRFVSDASHELRTPLTSIKGNIDFLKKVYKDNPEMTAEIVHEISSEVDRMARLLNNLLSLARADAGYKMHRSEILLREVVEEVVTQIVKLKPEIHLKLHQIEILDDTTILGNRDYLIQLFYILLENAFKYTKEGSVTLSFEKKKEEASSQEWLRISIADTGIGIAQSDIDRIFDRFYRAENTESISGTGLGLPIAKWIVEQHHGTIVIESELGLGTTVSVQLPLS